MSTMQRKVFADAMKLPTKAKVRLVGKLLNEIEADNLAEVEAAWKQEIKRRIDAFERGELDFHSGEEVLRALKKRFATCA